MWCEDFIERRYMRCGWVNVSDVCGWEGVNPHLDVSHVPRLDVLRKNYQPLHLQAL